MVSENSINVILISVTYFNEGPKVKLFETLSLECFIGKAFCPLLLNSETCIVDSRPPGLSSLGQAQNFYCI